MDLRELRRGKGNVIVLIIEYHNDAKCFAPATKCTNARPKHFDHRYNSRQR